MTHHFFSALINFKHDNNSFEEKFFRTKNSIQFEIKYLKRRYFIDVGNWKWLWKIVLQNRPQRTRIGLVKFSSFAPLSHSLKVHTSLLIGLCKLCKLICGRNNKLRRRNLIRLSRTHAEVFQRKFKVQFNLSYCLLNTLWNEGLSSTCVRDD